MKYIVLIALIALGVCVYVMFFHSDDIAMLKKRGVPVPEGQSITMGTESGGFFSSHIFAAIQLDENALQSYIKTLNDAAPEAGVISPTGNCVIVIPGKKNTPYDPDSDKRLLFVPTHSGDQWDWWQVYLITNGLYYEKDLPNACGYMIYLDLDRRIAYIYWHYS